MKYVVIVNGKPESGKTSFEQMCNRYLDGTEDAHGHILSSINPIKNIYRKIGWNGYSKTDKVRKDLSVLKKMWLDNTNGNGPTGYIVNNILAFNNDEDHVIFVDIREESEIEKLVNVLKALECIDIKCTTVLVDRPDNAGIEYGNKSDDMVGTDKSLYNTIIVNGGDLDDLDDLAIHFIDKLLEE